MLMPFRLLVVGSILCAVSIGCNRTAPSSAGDAAGATQSARTIAPVPKAVKAADALASQNTNWPGVVADVVEFRRRGNILTVVARLRNQADPGASWTTLGVSYDDAFVLDEAGGKKYKVLKDEQGAFIAGGPPNLPPGQEAMIWMKFPAPPAEIKAATFAFPMAPPFEDLPIQEQ